MEDLQRILKRWCNASGAKFNTQKTEIISIGTLEHRVRVIETQKANRDSEEIPAYIHIAKDGEPVRILETWIGNKIIQMVVGEMTQYLTQVQGMPTSTEKKLEKKIRKFM